MSIMHQVDKLPRYEMLRWPEAWPLIRKRSRACLLRVSYATTAYHSQTRRPQGERRWRVQWSEGVVDLRGTPVVRQDLAKWSIGCLDLATVSCRQTLLLDSQLLSLGLFATTHPHQLANLVGNVEAFVLAADCERCRACEP